MNNKLVSVSIALTVGVLLLGTLLVPILHNSTDYTKTYINEGATFSKVDESTHTIEIKSIDGVITIITDGKLCTYPDMSYYGSAPILGADHTFIRLNNSGEVEIFGSTSTTTYGHFTVGYATGDNVISIAISGDQASVGSYSISGVKNFIASKGDLVLSYQPHVLTNTEVYVGALTRSGSTYIATACAGNLDNLTIYPLWPSGRVVSLGEVDLIPVTTNLYKLDKINAVWDNSGVPIEIAYSYLIVPQEIVYDNPGYLGMEGVISIMLAIPVFIIIAFIGVAISVIKTRN